MLRLFGWHRRGDDEAAAGGIEAGPDAAAPADFDEAIGGVEHEQHLLAGVELLATEQAETAARDVGGQDVALGGFHFGPVLRGEGDGFRPPAKRKSWMRAS